VIVRLAAHCRRRYKRACDYRVPATVTAPGPPKAVGKGLFTNAFIAMLLVERSRRGGARTRWSRAWPGRERMSVP
jgi:transposase